MNNRHNDRFGSEKIREVFTFIVGGKMFKTSANKEQFSKALEYVNIVGTGTKLNTLEAVLKASGFYVEIKNETIHGTFSI